MSSDVLRGRAKAGKTLARDTEAQRVLHWICLDSSQSCSRKTKQALPSTHSDSPKIHTADNVKRPLWWQWCMHSWPSFLLLFICYTTDHFCFTFGKIQSGFLYLGVPLVLELEKAELENKTYWVILNFLKSLTFYNYMIIVGGHV